MFFQLDRFLLTFYEFIKLGNISFEFGDERDAEIRIAFIPGGSWSYIGTDSLRISSEDATMNLSWVDQGIVLHELGHALGLGHEHQPPDGGIQWNREVVIQDLIGPPTFWTRRQIEHNVLKKYDVGQTNGVEFDPKSIMLYRVPPTWTLDGFHTEFNTALSAGDKGFIASGLAYPE